VEKEVDGVKDNACEIWVRAHYRQLRDGRIVYVRGYWRKIDCRKMKTSSYLFRSYTSPTGSFVIESYPARMKFVQIFNPRIKRWMKIDIETGKVVGVKREAYKGVERWEK